MTRVNCIYMNQFVYVCPDVGYARKRVCSSTPTASFLWFDVLRQEFDMPFEI